MVQKLGAGGRFRRGLQELDILYRCRSLIKEICAGARCRSKKQEPWCRS